MEKARIRSTHLPRPTTEQRVALQDVARLQAYVIACGHCC